MYTLARTLGLKQFLLQQMPMLTISFVIAEIFYKFGSFALECLAFLATWVVLDILANLLTSVLGNTPGHRKTGSENN